MVQDVVDAPLHVPGAVFFTKGGPLDHVKTTAAAPGQKVLVPTPWNKLCESRGWRKWRGTS